MSKIINVTDDDKRRARLAGFKKRKPKKPKTKTVKSLESWISRHNKWASELKAKATKGKKLDDLRQTVAAH